jgi:ATP-binding cassette, subfamily B, bacterial CvaB/MchF/RaxB
MAQVGPVMNLAEQLVDIGLFAKRSTPVVLQTEAAECGLACMAMLAGRYGYKVDLPAMRRQCNISLKGATLRDLIRIGSQVKLDTRALRVEIDQLYELQLPCILHWDHNHFVVLTAVKRNGVVIHDPAFGVRVIPTPELSRRFTGIALEAWPSAEFERKTERSRVKIMDLIRRTHGVGAAAGQILLMSLFLEAVVIVMPIGFQVVIDEVIVANDRSLLVIITIGLGLLLAFRSFIEFARQWSILTTGVKLSLQWKLGLFHHLLKLPLDYFERRHVGDIASRFTSLETVQATLTTGPIPALIDGVMSLGLLAMMWLYNTELALIAVSVMVLYAGVRFGFYQAYRKANEEAIVYGARENSHFIETLRGMPSIKALVMGDRRKALWSNYLADHVGAGFRVQKINLAYQSVNSLLFGFDRVVIIFLGASAVISGTMTIGMLIAFLAYKDQFSQRISKLFDTAVQLRLLTLHGSRIADVALTEPEQSGGAPPVLLPLDMGPRHKATLSARGLAFRYGDNEPLIISGLDLDVAAGECVAIVGPSGAGKTTLLKLLAGLLQPTTGTILLNDVPITSIGLESYRTQIGCVLQDDRLFSGSIAENIASFAPGYDPDRVQDAARLAAIHDEVLRMPMGYETLVGDMGSSLSGGQIQRIVLARALYRGPRILLLDEATSHLDDENEKRINASVRSLPIARIILAHRKTTIEMADRLISVLPNLSAPVLKDSPAKGRLQPIESHAAEA